MKNKKISSIIITALVVFAIIPLSLFCLSFISNLEPKVKPAYVVEPSGRIVYPERFEKNYHWMDYDDGTTYLKLKDEFDSLLSEALTETEVVDMYYKALINPTQLIDEELGIERFEEIAGDHIK